jgi:hypothetical protein
LRSVEGELFCDVRRRVMREDSVPWAFISPIKRSMAREIAIRAALPFGFRSKRAMSSYDR